MQWQRRRVSASLSLAWADSMNKKLHPKQKMIHLDSARIYLSITLLHIICDKFLQRVIDKYIRGAAEHGGGILKINASHELEAELLDAYVYKTVLDIQLENRENQNER